MSPRESWTTKVTWKKNIFTLFFFCSYIDNFYLRDGNRGESKEGHLSALYQNLVSLTSISDRMRDRQTVTIHLDQLPKSEPSRTLNNTTYRFLWHVEKLNHCNLHFLKVIKWIHSKCLVEHRNLFLSYSKKKQRKK